jgi:FMN phosphatase YigB (HAD superfamily)
VAKPARGIFELACDSMGVPPSQAIYVGDRLMSTQKLRKG